MKVVTDQDKINEIFDRGIVTQILPSREELFKRLTSGDRLRIYIGADPTSTSLHLSHAKNYMFLEELRKLGHEVIVLFGDFTARIGDPTGRADARPQLTEEEVKKNVEEWLVQIKPLMAFDDPENPPRVLYNSEWLSKLQFADILSLASTFTVQQMIERDMFEKRWENNIPIHLHEFLYPLMQGYDSVAMDVDIELCGTDQIFNALAGRTLLKRLKNKEKCIIALNLMENPKTGELMSKSRGTGVFLSNGPKELFGSIMSQPDEMIEVFLVNNTRIPLDQKESILSLGPRESKARVAREIVGVFHGEEKAKEAEEEFNRVFSTGAIPTDIEEHTAEGEEELGDLALRVGLVQSKSEWRRLIDEGAVTLDEKKIEDIHEKVRQGVLKVGKRRFAKITAN